MASASTRYDPTYVADMLECAVCLDIVRSPHTLVICLHSFCKECVEQLIEKQQNEEPGVVCPVCRNFCGKNQIKYDFFRKDLVDMYISIKENQTPQCEQCEGADETVEATHKCLECKMVLCESCKGRHLTIKVLKNHRVLPIDSENPDFIIDHLEFCPIHTDEPIKLFCGKCSTCICMTCKVTKHDNHKTTTVTEALEQMLPEIKSNMAAIDEHLSCVTEKIVKIDVKIKDTKTIFNGCIEQINQIAEQRIQQIQSTRQKQKADLEAKMEKEVDKLENAKEDLNKNLSAGENVKKVVENSLDRARNASLLTQLIDGGLHSKLSEIPDVKSPTQSTVTLDVPFIDPNVEKWDDITHYGITGKIGYKSKSVNISPGDPTVTQCYQSRQWNVTFTDFFKQKFNRVVDVKRPDYCSRISLIQDNLWVPLVYGNINVYNKNGNVLENVNIQNPRSVKEAHNNDIIIACRENKGMHIVKGDNTTYQLIGGSFSDLYALNDKMYTLEFNEKAIYELSCDAGEEDVTKRWRLSRKVKLDDYQTRSFYDTLLVKFSDADGETDKLHFYVMSQPYHTLHLFSEDGKQIQSFQNNMSRPYLCGIDNKYNLLISDKENKVYKLFSTINQQWGETLHTVLQSEETCVWDIIPADDGSVWQVGSHIRKYIPQ